MDLAKNFAHWRDQSPEQWIAQANRYLPPIVVGVLVLLIAFKAADLTWRLLDSPTADESVPAAVRTTATGPGRTADSGAYETLRAWEPFGHPPDESAQTPIPAEVVLDAPDTTLNLTLNGLVVAQRLPEPGTVIIIHEKGTAIISSGRGEQKTYRKGDAIDSAPNATLHSVFTDRVLLDRGGGRLESLRFPEADSAPQANSRVAARPQLTGSGPVESLSAAASIADAAGEAAALIGEHMQIAMHTENGQPVGFRLEPRGDGRVFAQLGLEPGDVLTEVNGIRLNDMRNTSRVLEALAETQQASVTIRRNQTDMAMVLDVGQIQRLAESLQ
jgi:general secretion pathway protein C